MDHKINYLKKYHKDVEIVQDGFDGIENVPTSWNILNLSSTSDRINTVMQMWDKVQFWDIIDEWIVIGFEA